MAPRADLRRARGDAGQLPGLPGPHGGAGLSPLAWTDPYGAVHAVWTGLPGGHRWLVVAAPEQAAQAALALPTRFKGELHLLACDTLTPLEATVQAWCPRGVLVVDRALSGGPALDVPAREVTAEGLTYREGGPLPAWTSALDVEAPVGECAPASAVAALGLPVVSCAPGAVAETLLAWWRVTPHALLPDRTHPSVQPVQR